MSLTKREKSQILRHIGYLLDTQCKRCIKKEQLPGVRHEKEQALTYYCKKKCPVGIRMNRMSAALMAGEKVNFNKMKPVKAPVIKKRAPSKRYHISCVDCQYEMYRVQRENGFGNCTKCGGVMKRRSQPHGRPPKKKGKVLSK